MPFVKLDCGLLDSSLWIDRNLRDVFITALLMAEPKEFSEPQRQIEVDTLNFTDFVAPPEWYGFCPAAGSGIVRRALVEPTAGMEALKQLGSADPESRNKKFDGRRMIRVNGGFLILNYMDFRDHDYTAADRMRRLRARQRSSVTRNVNDVTPNKRNDVTKNDIVHPNVTQAESRVQRAEAEGERPPTPQAVAPKAAQPPYDPSADPLENIPEGLALLQYAGFVAEQVGIPAGYALKVKIGDTLGIMASGGLMGSAVRELIGRMKAAGTQKWLFWLEDGGWKDDAGSNATEAAFLGGSA